MSNPLNIDLEKELGLDNLPLEQQRDILANIGETIFGGVIARVIEVLDDSGKDELSAILEKEDNEEDNEEELLKFLEEKVPNFQDLVNEEVADFKKEGLDFFKKMQEK